MLAATCHSCKFDKQKVLLYLCAAPTCSFLHGNAVLLAVNELAMLDGILTS